MSNLTVDFFGNSFSRWLAAVVIFFVVYFLLKIFKTVLLSRLKKFAQKTKNEFDDVIVNGLDAIHWPFNLFLSVYLAQFVLLVSVAAERALNVILILTVSYYLIRVAQAAIDVFIGHIISRRRGEQEGKEMMKLISTLIKLGLWGVAVLLVLSNLGYNVNSLIAGLGVSGIVVAFAVQKIAADLFSSLSIYFDKPFAPGDFVKIGEDMGTVKQVGLRTTRITSLSGEEIIIPNSEITTTRIQNFGKMKRRRAAFSIGVTYDTAKANLEKIPGMIKDIISKQKNCDFDRAHFKSFGDFSLNFEVVYYLNSADYNEYMNAQQAINLAIVAAFEKESIKIAFPTQTIHLEK
jgi:small-conductance mechanosensitive channel